MSKLTDFIEAQNPGIDIERVARERAARRDAELTHNGSPAKP